MVSATIGRDHYKTELVSSGHHLIADEPIDKNGNNMGPPPGEFLMIALASCTAITLRMYADRKNLAVESIKVEIGTEKLKIRLYSIGIFILREPLMSSNVIGCCILPTHALFIKH